MNSKAQTQETPGSGPKISFTETSHDFGDIKQGDKVTYIFKFKNTGNAPLIISAVTSQCGCTSPQWSKDPVMPGKEGEITITFDSAGKQGMNNKPVQVLSNSVPVILKIRGNVLPKSKSKKIK